MRPTGEREDPRVVRSRACVLAAAVAILEEDGAARVTVEGVAARAGVAKTTLYRLWPGRNELLVAAYEQLVSRQPVEPGPDLRSDVLQFVGRLNDLLRDDPRSRILPGLVDQAERDAALGELCRHFAERRRAALVGRLEQARTEGELAADTDIELLAAELVGVVFYRRYFARTPLDAEQVRVHVDRLLGSVRTPASASSGSDGPPRSPR